MPAEPIPSPGRPGRTSTGQRVECATAGQIPVRVRHQLPASLDLAGGTTTGATDGWVHVQNLVAACPNTRLVLGGYSQGADVIDLLTTTAGAAFGTPTPMPDAVAGHIAAVVVFGNPSRRVGGGPLPTRSVLYGSKAVDVCLTGDPICSNGMDLAAHARYVSSGLVHQAALFAASRLALNAG